MRPFPKLENIYPIAIPLPEPPDLITANVYAVGKGPIALIDTGPKTPGSLQLIQEKLKSAGFNLNDIERIIVTHGHVDHFGLAMQIRKAAEHRIECFIHAEDAWKASWENFREEMWSEEMDQFMTMAGMPRNETEKIKKRFSSFRALADPLDDISVIEDGDEFTGHGYHLRVIHTPGHSPGCTCIYEPHHKILFSGDHIIKHITPNPLVEMKRDRLRDPSYQSLRAYMDSLDKLTGLNVQFVFPGHGEYIADLPGIISSFRAHHHERMDLVWRAVRKEPRAIYHVINCIFPFIPENDVFLAVSEVFVHLEVLIKEGKAELADPGPPAVYRTI